MKTIEFNIQDPSGLHARPAANLVELLSKYSSEMSIVAGEKTGNAKSAISIMMLGIKGNGTVLINIEGSDEEQAAKELTAALQGIFL